ncbi:MAG TPA: glycosyltransferase family 39 protein [Saprospiraceae bacterium]|nr:glycosyltransferase family 39 protein [Saprospiraceae bacterium]
MGSKGQSRKNLRKQSKRNQSTPLKSYSFFNNFKLFNPGEKVFSIISILTLSFIFATIYLTIFDEKVDLNGDNLNYYYLAKNVSERGIYSLYYDHLQKPHGHFPPGYPFLLSIFMKISQSVNFIKAINGFLLLASSITLYFTFRRFGLGKFIAFTGAFMVLYNASFLSFSTIMMSEIPFVFFSTFTIYLISISDFNKPFYKNPTYIIAVILLYYTFLIRSQGIALLPGVILFLILTRRWVYILGTIVVFGIVSIPWNIRNSLAGGGSSYLNQLLMKNPYWVEEGRVSMTDLLSRVINNSQRYIDKELPVSIVNNLQVVYSGEGYVQWTYWWIGLIIIILTVIGLIAIKNNRSMLFGYIAGTFGVLLLWPDVWFSNRFILPIIPFIAVAVIHGIKVCMELLMKWTFKQNPGFNTLLLVPLIVFLNKDGVENLKIKAQQKTYPPAYQNYFNLANWAKNNLNPDNTVIIARKPELFHHFSAIHTASFSRTPDESALLDGLKRVGATHVVVDQLGYADTGRYLLPVVQNNPGLFTVIHKTGEPETYLIRFNTPIQ